MSKTTSDRAPRLLVIAPHPDDEILGAGGTIARYAAAGGKVTVLTVAAHMPPLYSDEVHQQTLEEAERAHAVVGVTDSRFLNLPAVFVHETPHHELNGKILEVIADIKPDTVLIPFPDRHQDHQLIFSSAMVATRPVGAGKCITMLAAYETLSETHWNAPHIEPNFQHNWTVDITAYLEPKLEALACYASQIPPFPGPRSIEAVRALATFRGTQAGFAYGESMQIIRTTASPDIFRPAHG